MRRFIDAVAWSYKKYLFIWRISYIFPDGSQKRSWHFKNPFLPNK